MIDVVRRRRVSQAAAARRHRRGADPHHRRRDGLRKDHPGPPAALTHTHTHTHARTHTHTHTHTPRGRSAESAMSTCRTTRRRRAQASSCAAQRKRRDVNGAGHRFRCIIALDLHYCIGLCSEELKAWKNAPSTPSHRVDVWSKHTWNDAGHSSVRGNEMSSGRPALPRMRDRVCA